MAVEAITQLNETAENPVKIDSYTLRDVSIKNALVTPDDDNGIEVLLNMRPSLHTDASSADIIWWDFNVSSVDQEGNKSDHMAGTIGINNRSARPKVKAVPEFTQRSSGKAWNRALRSVGFDYGPTFQDMDEIQFAGKTYAGACKTAIRTKVDGTVGESRHILHPACIDSCLQLLIVSIYAGHASAMPCGAVPIQVDEVSIWVPSAEQVTTQQARALSWIDERGVRALVGSSQLVAADGDVVMEISDMRCSLYEAAVPQRLSVPAKPRLYGNMEWKRDVSDVVFSSADVSVAKFVELTEFKKPGLKVADLTDPFGEEIRELSSEIYLALPGGEGKKSPFKEGSFDLAISASDRAEDMTYARSLPASGGRAIIISQKPNSVDTSASGFSRIEATFASFFAASADEETETGKTEKEALKVGQVVQIFYRDGDTLPQSIYVPVKQALEALGYAVMAYKID